MNLRRSFAPILVAVAVIASGCTGSRPKLAPVNSTAGVSTTVAPPTTLTPPGTSLVAETLESRSEVPIFEKPDATLDPKATLTNPNPNGAPLVFLVKQAKGAWYEVYLPVRPNGSTGWVQADLVKVSPDPYRIVVSASSFALTLYKNDKVVKKFEVGIGRDQYPTPGGVYYIKELLQPPDPNGAYGPFAYGLSGFSEVAELANFSGGDGTIGIHGTNDPSSVGSSDSHGCIRMNNEDITTLSEILPLGTPVEIEA